MHHPNHLPAAPPCRLRRFGWRLRGLSLTLAALVLAPMVLAPMVLAVAGCGDSGSRVASAGTRPANVSPTAPILHATTPPVHVQQLPGVEGVIGADAAALIRQFGKPRLDVREGDARKLQFVGAPCVLDVYLYPFSPGRAPLAAYVDARRRGDAREVDRVACIAMLRQR